MGTTTTNLGLYKPDNGETGWGALVNASLDTLDGQFFSPSGDVQSVYVATAGQRANIKIGTSGSPNTSVHPAVKVVRTISMPRASVTGDGGEQMAAVLGISVGDASNQVQTVGVYGGALNAGTANGGSGGVDSCAVYAVGKVTSTGIGVAIGAYVQGRVDSSSATAKANGLEVRCSNYNGTAGTLTTTGFSNYTGIWVNCDGTANSSVGLAFGNPFGFQWLTGIHFNAQVTGGFTGGAKNESIRDDGNAATSILINGTHATAAVAVAAGSGPIVIGGTAAVGGSSSLFEVQAPNSGNAPIALFGSTTNTQSYVIFVRNATGTGRIAIGGSAGNPLTGMAAGDLALYIQTSGKSTHLGGTTSVVQVTAANTLGFFQTTPIAQYATTGTSAGFTAGGGTTVTDASTFTGNTGSTAYRISDIVRALKLYGLIAA